MKLFVKAVLSGLATYVPGYDYAKPTGGTDSARYCYSVWLRHLVGRHAAGVTGLPESVAELGPGDSIGIGLAALISGVERYVALDVVPYTALQSNLSIFDDLVELFRRREPIPANEEYPSLKPRLESYDFPYHLLSEVPLERALLPERIDGIRASIEETGSRGSRLRYVAPWSDATAIEDDSMDMIYSQAVLEHVEDLPGAYEAMRRWLRPGGVMTHQIDYRCHGKADAWNGHWTYSDRVWKIIVGRRAYLLNRAPHSEQLRLLRESGFEILSQTVVRTESVLSRRQLAARFRGLSQDDLTTSGAFVVAAAPKSESP